MATVTQWTPFGVALNVTATASTVTRTSATQYTVKINVSWESYWDNAKTMYGMTATSGGSTVTINPFGTKATSGSGTLTGTYSISGNGSATKTVTVTFKNFNSDTGASATKNVSFSVTVPAWTSYKVAYNANGGSGAPSSQTKWKNQALTLSSTKPTRTGYSFQGWATSSSGSVAYAAGASYTANAAVTLYAVWKANTYTVSYNANGGSGAPSSQTKTYGVTLTLSSTKPTRTNYNFKGWGTSAGATTVSYASGASYTANAAITLYAIWELAYVKPRITSFSVARCNSSGTVIDSGTYALVKFNWACDKTVSSITIKWKLASAASYSNSTTVSASGTSGTVSQVVGAGGISTDSTYNVQVTVADASGSSYDTKTIQSIAYPIDIKSGGKGIAFGKAAESDGYMDVGYKAKFNDDVTGPVLGLTMGTASLPDGADMNNYLIPGIYTSASGSYKFTNHPTGGGAGKLYVISGLGQSMANFKSNGTWLYGIQFWVSNGGAYIAYRALRTGSTAGAWEYDPWYRMLDTANYTTYTLPRSHLDNKVLWTGAWYMTAGHTATLSEAITAQGHGIVLVFSQIDDGSAQDYGFHEFFVPKKEIELKGGFGHTYALNTNCHGYMATKYLYISNTQITGHANNNISGTSGSGVTYDNSKWVLRYVLGV